jgi:predicted dehydrogenase
MSKNNKKLKVGFLGGGINSAIGYAHYAALNIDNRFKIVCGVFSLNKNINQKTGEVYKVNKDRVYSNIDDLIRNEKYNLDAVIVLTPINIHAEQIIKLLDNKLPVICEKALASSIKELQDINDSILKNNGYLAVIYNYLGYPMLRELKYLIKNESLGKINQVQIEMPMDPFSRVSTNDGTPIKPQDWRLVDKQLPIISLDLGVHLHMIVYYLTGEKPIEVISKYDSYGNFSYVVDNINCIIEYSNSVTCNMWYSKVAIGYRNGLKIRVFGDKGSAFWYQEDPENLICADNTGNKWVIDRGNNNVNVCNNERYNRFKVGHPSGFIEAFANYYYDIAKSLYLFKTKKELKFSECFGFNEALEGIKLFTAINKSNSSKKWEKL